MAGGITVVTTTAADWTDELLEERFAVHAEVMAESRPEDPPPDVEREIRRIRARPERHRQVAFDARDSDGTLLGFAGFDIDPTNDPNPDLLEIGAEVLGSRRREGAAAALLGAVTDWAGADGRTRLRFWTNGRIPAGAHFARSVGAELLMESHVNRLAIDDVDRDMMERWVAEASTRSADYELISIADPCPDEHAEGLCQMIEVLNTAPRDGFQHNDFTISVAELREFEAMDRASGNEVWTLLARNIRTGEYAGMHDVNWSAAAPDTVFVGLTAVDPTHRGHALGKWLKAAMTLRIMDERPGVVDIRTGNADSNDAMLGINELMGYQHYISQQGWEIATADAAAWCAARRSR